MAQSEVEIINEAMLHLGKQMISDRKQGISEARASDRIFDHTRDEVLRVHNWSRATKRIKLARLASTDSQLTGLFDYDFGFAMPNDYIRMSPQTNIRGAFRIEGNVFLTNEAEVNLVYVTNDISFYPRDPNVTSLISLLLASKLAIALTGDINRKVMLKREYDDLLDEATYVSDVDGGTGDSFAYNRMVEGGFGNPRQSLIRNDAEGLSSGS